MKAVYSYWEDFEIKLNGGFRSAKEMALVLTLSVIESKKQFSSVEFYTTEYGKKIVEDYQIPFDKVYTILDDLTDKIGLNPQFWAFAKIYVYSLQTVPFIHIDNDVIIWGKLPENILNSKVFFQNKEHLSTHQGYTPILKFAKENLPNDIHEELKEVIDTKVDWAYNCGVVGGNDFSLFKKWREIVESYIFNNELNYWEKVKDKHSQNHFFEQYFISSLIKITNTTASTLLRDDFMKSATRDFRYTHLWGEVKRDPKIINKVKERLYLDYPEVQERFEKELSDSEVFTDIYRNELWGKGAGSGGGSSIEITEGYRQFLQDFLKENKVKTVVDFGSGDWQFSKLINWSGIKYLGIDCVEAVVKKCTKQHGKKNIKFLYADSLNELKETKYDLLLLKDVIIHWPNEKISSFFKEMKEKEQFSYILVTVQSNEEKVNEDIKVGEFHNLDLQKEPFLLDCEVSYRWDNDKKTTYLFKL